MLLVRGFDVDEYKPNLGASGEWDRVYFSSNPDDIKLAGNYTAFPTTTKWNNTITSGGPGTNGQGYKLEITKGAYLGALFGADQKWNTSVIPFAYNEIDRIALEGKFRPDEPVSIAELATDMGRYLDLKTGASVSNHFSDTEGHWAGAIIEALYANKFIKGYPNGTFKPSDRIIRV